MGKQASREKRAGPRQAKINWYWANRYALNKARTYARSLKVFTKLMLRSVKKDRSIVDAHILIKQTADRLHNAARAISPTCEIAYNKTYDDVLLKLEA